MHSHLRRNTSPRSHNVKIKVRVTETTFELLLITTSMTGQIEVFDHVHGSDINQTALNILCIRLKQLRILSEMENRTSLPNVGCFLRVLCLTGAKSSLLLVLNKGSCSQHQI